MPFRCSMPLFAFSPGFPCGNVLLNHNSFTYDYFFAGCGLYASWKQILKCVYKTLIVDFEKVGQDPDSLAAQAKREGDCSSNSPLKPILRLCVFIRGDMNHLPT